MPQIILTPTAIYDLKRVHNFLSAKSPILAQRASAIIIKSFRILLLHPNIGKPIDNIDLHYRELIIPFGESGYIALYLTKDNITTILALRHQKEAGY